MAPPRTRSYAVAAALLLGVWGWRLDRLRRSVPRAAVHWSQPQGTPGGLLLVALGDSAAQGIGARDPDHGYVAVLARRLARAAGRPVQVVNLSVSGARLRDVVRDQLPRLAALNRTPDLVTVGVGGNDLRRYVDEQYRRDVADLVAGLPPGRTVLADIPFFGHGRAERDAAAAAHLLRERAAAAGLAVAPLHEAMRARGWAGLVGDYAADGFHPDDSGHRVWADAFWAALEGAPALRAALLGAPSPR